MVFNGERFVTLTVDTFQDFGVGHVVFSFDIKVQSFSGEKGSMIVCVATIESRFHSFRF